MSVFYLMGSCVYQVLIQIKIKPAWLMPCTSVNISQEKAEIIVGFPVIKKWFGVRPVFSKRLGSPVTG